jgi:hypothetical protein
MLLGQIGGFHLRQHEEYERQLDLYPRIPQKSTREKLEPAGILKGENYLVTSFGGDGVWLAFILRDSCVDAVDYIRSDWCFEDSGKRNGADWRGVAGSEDVDLRSGGLHNNDLAYNFVNEKGKSFHRYIHHH